MRRALAILVVTLAALVLLSPGIAAPANSASTTTRWTIMIYMSANASPELPLMANLDEMEAAVQANGTNIIALADLYGVGVTRLYRVNHDPGGINSVIVSSVVDDGGAVIPASTNNSNMGSPETLSSFIEFGAAHYPADRYALILWGHAADWYGVCPDGTDILTLPELRIALRDATTVLGRPIDLVGVDACAEASLEMLYEIHDYTRYLVAAENNIPSQGLPYMSILNGLAQDVNETGLGLGISIAKDFVSWSRNNSVLSASMAVFNLSRTQPFIDRLDSWVGSAARYEGLFHKEMQVAVNESEFYETDWQHDFGSLVAHIATAEVPIELKMTANETMEAFLQMRAYASTFDNADAEKRVREATGAVVYFPSSDFVDRTYGNLKIASTGWAQFSHMLRRYAPSNASVTVPELSFSAYHDYGSGLYDSFKLVWPDAYSEIDLWVFRQQLDELIYCGHYASTGTNITVHEPGVIGNLIISASAGSSDSAVSYEKIGPVAITGEIRINLTLNGTIRQGSDVRIVLRTDAGTVIVNATLDAGHTIPLVILTPRDVEIGDNVSIEVTLGSKMNGSYSFVLNSTSAAITVDVKEIPSTTPSWMWTVLWVVLAVVLIGIFAVLLYRERKRSGLS